MFKALLSHVLLHEAFLKYEVEGVTYKQEKLKLNEVQKRKKNWMDTIKLTKPKSNDSNS